MNQIFYNSLGSKFITLESEGLLSEDTVVDLLEVVDSLASVGISSTASTFSHSSSLLSKIKKENAN